MSWRRGKFPLACIILQVTFIVLFAIFVRYDHGADAHYDYSHVRNTSLATDQQDLDGNLYAMFQDVHVMIFVGFGFLMTFMKKYGYSAVGLNLLVSALALQWGTLVAGFFHLHDGKIDFNVMTMFTSDFACAAVLITFGALLGRLSPMQMVVMTMCEIVIFTGNEVVGLDKFLVVDVGGSMFVHVFGAYFGLAVSAVIHRKGELEEVEEKNGPVYHSDLFAMIGTLFLWMFWPSFNSALAPYDDQHRAVINTYLALATCVVVSFALSALVCHDKFEMEHIQNSTLAGGVAVGTTADFMIGPFGSMCVGAAAAFISVLGYKYITPRLNKLRLNDSCGVHNLHGMPGVLAGIAGVIAASQAEFSNYGHGLYHLFPARVPTEDSPEWPAFTATYDLPPGEGRTATQQALWQLAALGLTLAIAIVGGLVTGLILRLPIWNRPEGEEIYEDHPYWEVPEDYVEEQYGVSGVSNQAFNDRTLESNVQVLKAEQTKV